MTRSLSKGPFVDPKVFSSKTKVILPVHLYGSVVDIVKIKKLIKKKKDFYNR